MNDNDLRRAEFCVPIRGPWSGTPAFPEPRDFDGEMFFCELGTLGCTEAHGDWEEAAVPRLRRERHIERCQRGWARPFYALGSWLPSPLHVRLARRENA